MLNVMKTTLILFLAALGSGLLSSPTLADGRYGQGFSRPYLAERFAAAPSRRISADEAAARVQQEYGGRILAVETVQRNGEIFYRIKVLTRKGVVRVVRIRAEPRR